MNPHLWKVILHLFILPSRSRASAEKYSMIWTDAGSPLNFYMRSLSEKVERALRSNEVDACVRCAMAYGNPSIEAAFTELVEQNCTRFVVVPLYPQSAFSTTQVIKDRVLQTTKKIGIEDAQIAFIDRYCDRDGYAEAIATSLNQSGFSKDRGDRVLFCFHSIPLCDIENGDTYDKQTAESAIRIAEALGIPETDWAVGYQCRFDKSRKWLSPTTKDVLSQIASEGHRVFVVAPNFSVDCLETLYDIEIELREFACDGQLLSHDDFIYASCLNDTDEHVNLLTALLLDTCVSAQSRD